MKQKRLDLKSLQVKSFVTDIAPEKENTVKGGGQGFTFQLRCTHFTECIIPFPNN